MDLRRGRLDPTLVSSVMLPRVPGRFSCHHTWADGLRGAQLFQPVPTLPPRVTWWLVCP